MAVPQGSASTTIPKNILLAIFAIELHAIRLHLLAEGFDVGNFEADVIQYPAFGRSGCHDGFGKYHFYARQIRDFKIAPLAGLGAIVLDVIISKLRQHALRGKKMKVVHGDRDGHGGVFQDLDPQAIRRSDIHLVLSPISARLYGDARCLPFCDGGLDVGNVESNVIHDRTHATTGRRILLFGDGNQHPCHPNRLPIGLGGG